MRRFRNIEGLFIVGISLEQWLKRRKFQLKLASFPNLADGRRLKDYLYAAEVARRKALPNSAVLGFCADLEDSERGRCWRRELKKCFRVQTRPTGLIWHPYFTYTAVFLSLVNDEKIVDKKY